MCYESCVCVCVRTRASAYTHPFKWSHRIFLDLMWYGVMTPAFKSFLCSGEDFSRKTMRSFLQQRTLALLQHVLFSDDIMLLEDFAFLFNEGHVKQKAGGEQRMCGCEKKKNSYILVSNLSKLQFSSLCFWWFSPNFCEPETLSHMLYPPTHAHTQIHTPTHTHSH